MLNPFIASHAVADGQAIASRASTLVAVCRHAYRQVSGLTLCQGGRTLLGPSL